MKSLITKVPAYKKLASPVSEKAHKHKDLADDPKAGQSEPREL